MSNRSACISRRALLSTLSVLSIPALIRTTSALAQDTGSQLASWNDGVAKRAIIDFVRATTDSSGPKSSGCGGAKA